MLEGGREGDYPGVPSQRAKGALWLFIVFIFFAVVVTWLGLHMIDAKVARGRVL